MVRALALALCGMCLYTAADAQQQRLHARIERPTPPPEGQMDASVGEAMRSLASRSGVVFVGQVAAVKPHGGVVDVIFRVERAVQGSPGAVYTLREWAGLWSAGQQRYAPGERALLFLQAPSAAGLSSPVDSMDGVVPLVPMGADAAPLLDVRRLAARVHRAVGEPMRGEAVYLSDAVTAMRSSAEPAPHSLPSAWPQPSRPLAIARAGVVDDAR